MCYMEHVGIRELRQNLSVYLARVKIGQVLTVTDRGRPVATLKPLDGADRAWQRLVDSGAVVPPSRPKWAFEPPKGEVDADRTTTRRLSAVREDRL